MKFLNIIKPLSFASSILLTFACSCHAVNDNSLEPSSKPAESKNTSVKRVNTIMVANDNQIPELNYGRARNNLLRKVFNNLFKDINKLSHVVSPRK